VIATTALELGLLGACLATSLAVARRAVRQTASACARHEMQTLATVRALLEASRRSSDAVLAALDASVREAEPAVDGLLAFVPSGDELACVYAAGARLAHFRNLRLRRGLARSLPAAADDAGCRASMPHDGAPLAPTDRFAVAVPMLDARGLHAVIYAASARALGSGASDAVVRAVERASAPYAIALEREADRADATYDGLTGLLSPRVFRRRLHDEVARTGAGAGRSTLSLWFVDTDSFKQINDAFGHRAGDAVLRAMASLLQAHLVTEVDLAARNGGDEFCALLRGTGKGRAVTRAQAFCEAVRSFDFGVPVRVTASVGVATFPHDAAGSGELLETADAAMYHSKRNGRDRVSFVAETGRFASVCAEAANGLSRSFLR
jgi:diguanylate cyclase (GGDEF)-like protein